MKAAARSRHDGQAAVEAVLALGAVALIWLLGTLVGHLQDLALQTEFAGRHMAFVAAQESPPVERARAPAYFFSAHARQWRNHDGAPLLGSGGEGQWMRAAFSRKDLSESAQVGGASLTILRTELLHDYPGIVSGEVSTEPRLSTAARNFSLPGRGVLSSRFAILAGAGHADSDPDAQARIDASPHAWGRAAQATARAGKRVESATGRVDAAWNRPLPQYDWLSAWSGLVPADRLDEVR